MMRRDNQNAAKMVRHADEDSDTDFDTYFTYRPLSNLPTPPPSSRNSSAAQSPKTTLDDGEPLKPRYLGPAIHLVNLIPSSTSLATASVPLVQAILSRADLPLETVALAVCILDSLDSRFARHWRVSCPLLPDYAPASKRHTLPAAIAIPKQLHIDSISPEIIILAALVIAVKFTEDPQEHSQYYVSAWGRNLWTCGQLNVTERCIMENLNYRIMPLCDEECLTDAMVDMQLAARQQPLSLSDLSPPDSDLSDEGHEEAAYVPSHGRSKTMMNFGNATLGLGLSLTPMDTPTAEMSQIVTQQSSAQSVDYFDHTTTHV